jgi:hypothetical protein
LFVLVFYTFINRSKDFPLHIRVSDNGYCAVFRHNIKKPFYIGEKSKVHVKVRMKGYNLPNKMGNQNSNWFAVKISVPDLKKSLDRTGIPEKDIKVILRFKGKASIK